MLIKALVFIAGFSLAQTRTGTPSPGVKTIVKGFERPVSVKFDHENAAYVVEQGGKVKKVEDKKTVIFLDISDRTTRIRGYSEQGLLDIAFPPDYPAESAVYVHYTDQKGDTVLSRFPVSKDRANPEAEKILLREKQPYSNHNGGQIEFGPDGFLYMALGDGGSAGDPKGNAQNLTSLLGKILRLKVSAAGYAPAPGNPFIKEAERGDAKPEIWALGLRNPWRFSFDGTMLYIADVGQHEWEEIDAEDTGKGGGKNYGWNTLEGFECYRVAVCNRKGKTPPVHVYRNAQGQCSVTGGYVYRGKLLPQLSGLYFYSDFCSGALRSFRLVKGEAADLRDWKELNPEKKNWGRVSSLGRDLQGELYILDYDRGALLKISPVLSRNGRNQ